MFGDPVIGAVERASGGDRLHKRRDRQPRRLRRDEKDLARFPFGDPQQQLFQRTRQGVTVGEDFHRDWFPGDFAAIFSQAVFSPRAWCLLRHTSQLP